VGFMFRCTSTVCGTIDGERVNALIPHSFICSLSISLILTCEI
jgi:hypothetical protein